MQHRMLAVSCCCWLCIDVRVALVQKHRVVPHAEQHVQDLVVALERGQVQRRALLLVVPHEVDAGRGQDLLHLAHFALLGGFEERRLHDFLEHLGRLALAEAERVAQGALAQELPPPRRRAARERHGARPVRVEGPAALEVEAVLEGGGGSPGCGHRD